MERERHGRSWANSSPLQTLITYQSTYRCSRLNKPCQPSVPIRRRNVRKSQQSRTAHLEEKLDDLVSLIRSQASKSSVSQDAAAVAGPAPQTTVLMTPSDSSPRGGSEIHDSARGTSTDNTSPAANTPYPEYSCKLTSFPSCCLL